MQPWAIPKAPAPMVKVSNAPLAANGSAAVIVQPSVNKRALLTPAPAPDNWVKAKAALIYINNAIAKTPINTPAPAPDIPEAPGKYTACKCATNYVWKDGACKPKEDYSACKIGALFYSDNTCSDKLESSKTLLGIVIYEKSASQNGWVMTHKPVATKIVWSKEFVDISGVLTTSSESKLTDIQASCTNTDKITAQGNSSTYPAAWAAKNYKEGGKTWCLPSGGLLSQADY